MEHMQSWLIPILIAGGAGLGLSILGKLMPKDKLETIMGGWGDKAAVALEFLLLKWFPLKTEQEVEEGVFCTLAYGVISFCNSFITKLKANNVKAGGIQ
jgi:hypothetical protein